MLGVADLEHLAVDGRDRDTERLGSASRSSGMYDATWPSVTAAKSSWIWRRIVDQRRRVDRLRPSETSRRLHALLDLHCHRSTLAPRERRRYRFMNGFVALGRIGARHEVLGGHQAPRDPVALVGPDQHRRQHHQRAQERDRDVERHDLPEVVQERQRRRRDDRDAGDRGERRHDERPAGPRRGRRPSPARGASPRRRSSTNRKRISDVNSVHAATTSGPPTAVIGLSLRLQRVGEQRRGADRDQHRNERQQRTDDAPQPDREEQEHEEDRDVGEDDAVRLEVVEQADAHDREARRRGADGRAAGAPSRGSRARPRPARRGRSGRCGR